MLIRCPKCNVSYDIGAANIPAEGKKVRCSQCGEIWLCTPADLIEEPQPEIVPPSENSTEIRACLNGFRARAVRLSAVEYEGERPWAYGFTVGKGVVGFSEIRDDARAV